MTRSVGNRITLSGVAAIVLGAGPMNFGPGLGAYFVGLLMLPAGLRLVCVGMMKLTYARLLTSAALASRYWLGRACPRGRGHGT
jgi:hypothetical protein